MGVAQVEGEKLQLLRAKDELAAELRKLMAEADPAAPVTSSADIATQVRAYACAGVRVRMWCARAPLQRASEHESELRLVRRLHDAQHALNKCEAVVAVTWPS